MEKDNDVEGLRKILERAISGFVPDKDSIDILNSQKNNIFLMSVNQLQLTN